MKFQDVLRTKRKEKGLSFDDIGKAIGVGKSTVAKWERGDIKNIGRDKLSALADVLGVSPLALLNDDSDSLEPENGYVNNDPELTAYLDELKNRKEMRMLFSLAAGATKEDVERTVKIVEAALGKQAKDE